MDIASHIDALLLMAFGIFFSYRGFRAPVSAPTKVTRIFSVGGPALFVIGALLLFVHAAPTWERHSTDDGFASAEFPGTPTRKEAVDTFGEASVTRVSYSYDDPGFTLQLSSSPALDAEATLEQRIESAVAFYAARGSEIAERKRVRCGDVDCYFLRIRQRDTGATGLVRFAVANRALYRVGAACNAKSGTPAEMMRFIESFEVRDKEPGLVKESTTASPPP